MKNSTKYSRHTNINNTLYLYCYGRRWKCELSFCMCGPAISYVRHIKCYKYNCKHEYQPRCTVAGNDSAPHIFFFVLQVVRVEGISWFLLTHWLLWLVSVRLRICCSFHHPCLIISSKRNLHTYIIYLCLFITFAHTHTHARKTTVKQSNTHENENLIPPSIKLTWLILFPPLSLSLLHRWVLVRVVVMVVVVERRQWWRWWWLWWWRLGEYSIVNGSGGCK